MTEAEYYWSKVSEPLKVFAKKCGPSFTEHHQNHFIVVALQNGFTDMKEIKFALKAVCKDSLKF